MRDNKQKYFGWLALLTTALVIFLYVFGNKIFRLDTYMFSSSHDVVKNYFTFHYYLNIQDAQYLQFKGMNYPYGDHLLYADNTPLLASIFKLLGINQYPVGLFNLFVISNYIIGPIIAFALSQRLKFKPIVGLVFSLFVVWVNPQIFNSTSASNLSMSSILLGTMYLLVCIFQEKRDTKYILLAFTIVVLASFIHLYYLILLAFILIPGAVFLFIKNRVKGIKTCISTLLAGILAYGLIFLTDQHFSERPKGSLGFNYHLWRSKIANYFESYDFLHFPSILEQKSQNIEWYGFIGSAYLIITILGVALYVHNRQKLTKKRILSSSMPMILFVLLVSFFTSIGNHIYIGESRTFNFLNPLHLISHITDIFNNFRFLSRFKFIVFLCSSILLFYIINKAWSKKYYKVVGIIALLICCFDLSQMANFAKFGLLKDESIFHFEHDTFKTLPKFEEGKYDAIIPIPYFHVGSETNGYIIDDNDNWSKTIFQLSIKNQLPLMATKLSRTPLRLSKQHFSLFQGETNLELLEKLKGKRILIAWTDQYTEPIMGVEPAKIISSDYDLFINKWKPSLLFKRDSISYYEIIF